MNKGIIRAGIFLGLILAFESISAQSLDRWVVSSQGGEQTQSGLSLEFTVGEAVVGTLGSSNTSLTQGFNQVVLDTQSSAVRNLGYSAEIKVYPNPATDILTIESGIEAKVEILDCTGKVILGNQAVSADGSTDVQINTLAAGIYLLHIRGSDGEAYMRWVKN